MPLGIQQRPHPHKLFLLCGLSEMAQSFLCKHILNYNWHTLSCGRRVGVGEGNGETNLWTNQLSVKTENPFPSGYLQQTASAENNPNMQTGEAVLCTRPHRGTRLKVEPWWAYHSLLRGPLPFLSLRLFPSLCPQCNHLLWDTWT